MSNTSDISDTTDTSELMYDAVTVSHALGVQESTLRKYCSLMQKHHYQFKKSAVGHRIFYQRDIDTLRKIIELKNDSSLTLAEAVRTVLNNDDDITSPDAYNKLLEEFSTFRSQQQRFNEELLQQLKQQQEYIQNSLKARDQMLMQSLRESQETKQLLLDQRKETKHWWQFWKV